MRRAEVRIALAVGASLALGLLVAAFRPAEVHGLGWDAPGYVVQMRAAALGVLDLPGSRPGVAATGAFLDGVGVLPIGLGPAGLSVAAAVCVGLGGAAALRRVWAVPAWGLGATVVLVATWGGTTRLASGYLANLVALTLFVLGVALALAPTARWPAVSAAFAACLLAHPGAAPAWAAILLAWAVLEGVAREDPDPSRAFSALSAFLAAAVVVTGAVAWRLGLSIEELQDLTVVRERFDERAAELVAWIGPGLSIAMIGAGIAIAALVGEGPRSRPAVRLGIVWMLVCALGLPLLALAPAVPGHRLLLLALPVPLLGARAIVGAASRLGVRGGPASARIAPVAAIVLVLGAAILALVPFRARASQTSSSLGPGPSAVAGYLRASTPDGPIVLVMDPPDRPGLLAWKARLRSVQALAPEGSMLRTVAYLGDERVLAAGRPTRRGGLHEVIVDRTWPSVRAVLDDRPVVLVVRSWVDASAWARARRLGAVVAGEVAVLRGPVPADPVQPVRPPSMPASEAVLRVAGVLGLLAAIGGGWARRAVGEAPGEVLALAPLAGLAVVVVAGVAVGIAGADPGGASGIAVVGPVALAGWIPSPPRRARR